MSNNQKDRTLWLALAILPLIAGAAEGYKPESDTRPVKEKKRAQAEVPDESGDKESGPAETPFPEARASFDFQDIEMLCVQDDGRKKPLHTVACEQLEQLVGRPLFATTTYIYDKFDKEKKHKFSAVELYVSIWMEPDKWKTAPVILVASGTLKKELGFDPEEKHFSFARLQKSTKLKDLIAASMTKHRGGGESDLTELEKESEIVYQRMRILDNIMAGNETLSLVPHPSKASEKWLSLAAFAGSYRDENAKQYYPPEKAESILQKYKDVFQSFTQRDSEKFRSATHEFRSALIELSPKIYPGYEALEREVTYNSLRPFGRAWMFYIAAAIIGAFSLRFKAKPLYYSMLAVFLGGLFFHVYGFALRCLIAGRPPVSNMYESVIWVGFGAVFFGLIFEMIYRKRYFAICGAGAGFLCLSLMDLLPVYAGNAALPGTEAGIKPLQPVLRDNFWLTVHVLTITLSYAAFMLTWVLGHVTLAKHLFQPAAKSEHHELHQFVYRGMQVGVLLLAIGTILGGVWAYYSWGRFWGWDPKETWAFITLMCYLVVLHGRFTGWWGNFGMSVGSVICFLSVVMAWYGVNFVLGSGLHAYGSGAGGEKYIFPLVGADLIFTIAAIARHAAFKSASASAAESDESADRLTNADPITEARGIGATPAESAGE